VSQVWRIPDGIDSKMRRRVKGWPATVGIGYRGPRKARHLHPSGYEEVIVRNVDDLAKVDPNTQAIRLAHTVGMKKRAEISVRAEERRIHILNPLPEEKPAEEEAGIEEAASKGTAAEESGKVEKEAEGAVKTEAEGEKAANESQESKD